MRILSKFLIILIFLTSIQVLYAYDPKLTEELQIKITEYYLKWRKENQFSGRQWLARQDLIKKDNEKLTLQIEDLVSRGADPNNPNKYCSIYFAIETDNIKLTVFLLHHGAQMENRDYMNMTVFLSAAYMARVELMELLAKEGADIKATYTNHDEAGFSALHLAARFNRLEATKALIRLGIDVNIKSDRGSTPLMLAAKEGCTEAMVELILHGADTQIKDSEGKTAFKQASSKEAKMLLESISPTAAPLKKNSNFKLFSSPDPKVILTKLENLRFEYENPLHAAVRLGWINELKIIVPYLQKKKVHKTWINEPNSFGFTPLNIAMILKYEEALEILTNFNAAYLDGMNSLILAKSIQANALSVPVLEKGKKSKKSKGKKNKQEILNMFRSEVFINTTFARVARDFYLQLAQIVPQEIENIPPEVMAYIINLAIRLKLEE